MKGAKIKAMKRHTFIVSLFTALSVIGNMLTASAAELSADINSVTSNVYISGSFAEGEYVIGDAVSIIVKKGNNAEDIVYMNQAKIGSDGSYSVKFSTYSDINISDCSVLVRTGDTLVSGMLNTRTDSFYKTDIELTNTVGLPLNLNSETSAKAVISMRNYFDDDVPAKAIIAFYDDNGKMLGMHIEDVVFGYEDSYVTTVAVDIPLNTSAAKGMLWKSKENLVPISGVEVNNSKDYNNDVYVFMFGDSLGHLQGVGDAQFSENRHEKQREVALSNPQNEIQQGWSCYIDDYLNVPIDNMYYNCYSGWTMRDALASSWDFSYRNSVSIMEKIKENNPNAKIYAMINMGTNDYIYSGGAFNMPEGYREHLEKMYNGYGIIVDKENTYPGPSVQSNGYTPVSLAEYESISQSNPESAVTTVKGLKDFGGELILITPASNIKTVSENIHVEEAGNLMREVADADKTDGIYLADIYTPSYDLFYNQIGVAAAREKYCKSISWFKEFLGDGGVVEEVGGLSSKYTINGNTYTTDYLHYNPNGARYVAQQVIKAVAKSDSTLKYHINNSIFE